jgi:hypothetical protein
MVRRGSQNVIYEYIPGHNDDEPKRRRYTLTFPNQRGRAYYHAGDVFLTVEYEQRDLVKIFPELASQHEGTTILQIVSGLLGLNRTKYKVGWKIERITASEDEDETGTVVCRAVLFITDNEVLPLQRTRVFDRNELHYEFGRNRRVRQLDLLNTGIEFVAESVQDLLTAGVSRNVSRSLGRRVVRSAAKAITAQQRRRLFFSLIRHYTNLVVPVVDAFITELAKALATQHQENQLRIRSGGRQRQEDVFRGAIARAASHAVSSFLERMASRPLRRRIDNAMQQVQQVDPILGRTLYQRIEAYISRRILECFAVDSVTVTIRAIGNAYARGLHEEGEFLTNLGRELTQELGRRLRSKLGDMRTDVPELFSEFQE